MDNKNVPAGRKWASLALLGVLCAMLAVKVLLYFPYPSTLNIVLTSMTLLCLFIFAILFSFYLIRDISHQAEQEKELRELNEKLAYDMQELAIRNEKMVSLMEMSDIVQMCANTQEASKAIAIKCRKILHFTEGSLYLLNPNNTLEFVASWGEPNPPAKIISTSECWALRKNSIYEVRNPRTELLCSHISEKTATPYMCIPLLAQNSILGLLYLEFETDHAMMSEENKLLIFTIVNTISLSLANIKLREILRDQSLHDSLTNLYNRRYLEEFLSKKINLAHHSHSPLSVMLIDIDFFKQVNDQYGHDAGDRVLQEFAKLFQNTIRSSDLACRYGGEEFIAVMHHCDLENAKRIAEDLRVKTHTLSVSFEAQTLKKITISIGISVFPEDGATADELIEAADHALYRAKVKRNCVISYSEMLLSDK